MESGFRPSAVHGTLVVPGVRSDQPGAFVGNDGFEIVERGQAHLDAATM